jgi:hypothetical protein
MEGDGGPIAPVIMPKLGRVIAPKPQHSVKLEGIKRISTYCPV